jgi:hypothetical protein
MTFKAAETRKPEKKKKKKKKKASVARVKKTCNNCRRKAGCLHSFNALPICDSWQEG